MFIMFIEHHNVRTVRFELTNPKEKGLKSKYIFGLKHVQMSYTLDALQEIIEKHDAKLNQPTIVHLTSRTRIAFICKCGTHHSKMFSSLFRG